jgi:hypothetical protein
MGMGLAQLAAPTAQIAAGRPIRSAIVEYVVVSPWGIRLPRPPDGLLKLRSARARSKSNEQRSPAK